MLLGAVYTDALYDFLEIDEFWNTVKTDAEYDLKGIFRYLVTERILHPDSIHAMIQRKDAYYEKSNAFCYHQSIRALDVIEENMEAFQDYLNRIIEKKVGRTKDYLYYDTTNFYMEQDFARPDTLPQKGVSKEHRTEPIVQLGLFLDSNHLPVRMRAFPGNTSDSLTYLPMINSIKDLHCYNRIISVADKGMNSNDNISDIVFHGDGYVFSQILRGKKGARYHEKMFEETEFTWNQDKSYKYRIFEEPYEYVKKDEKGAVTERRTEKRKVLIYWKKSIAEREAKKRELKLEKAEKYASNNAYGLTHDADAYVKKEHIDSTTGAVSDKTVFSVDREKAIEDARYDGFFCIVTSELSYTSDDIHGVYSQLSHIENAFRTCKSDFNLRPVYVWKDEHIKAYLMICFTALLMLRLLEFRLGKNSPSSERILRALSSYGCEEIAHGVLHLSVSVPQKEYEVKKDETGNQYLSLQLSENDETVNDLLTVQSAFGSNFNYVNVKQTSLNHYLKSVRFAITK